MEDNGTDSSGTREEQLDLALAAAHETYAAALAVIEADLAAGQITSAQAQAAAAAASAACERDCALARITSATGWHTWVGVGGVLYARRVRTSPPKVVRAADADGLRAKIAEAGESRRPAASASTNCTQARDAARGSRPPGPFTCALSATAGNAPQRERHPGAAGPVQPSGHLPVVPPGPRAVHLHGRVAVLCPAALPEPAPPAASGRVRAPEGDRR